MQLNDPGQQESMPPVGGSALPAAGDRFRPAPLSHTAMAVLQQVLVRNQRRRRVYHAHHLRVCVDGEERWQCDPGAGVSGLFHVPLRASYLEIFGDDEDGALLLAVFPLPDPEVVEGDGAQHMSVTLEGGQTVALEIALGEGRDGAVREYVIQMTYAESGMVETPKAGPPGAEALPEVPRPETSAPHRPQNLFDPERVD